MRFAAQPGANPFAGLLARTGTELRACPASGSVTGKLRHSSPLASQTPLLHPAATRPSLFGSD